MKKAKLQDTTLCAIVRDEAMNPAGGIVDFVDCTVPFVEAAVIVDTGSVDGTREMLEQLESQYNNLTVIDDTFTDYAAMRNVSLHHAQTTYALVLDADERLLPQDFANLQEIVQGNPKIGYNLRMINVFPDKEESGRLHNPRLFQLHPPQKRVYYQNLYPKDSEWLHAQDIDGQTKPIHSYRLELAQKGVQSINVTIKHFKPEEEAERAKTKDWYLDFFDIETQIPAPSTVSSFSSWKKYNPRRDGYR